MPEQNILPATGDINDPVNWQEVIDPAEERRRIRNTPLHQLTIDDVISHLLDDPVFFGYYHDYDDEIKRKYRINILTDVRTRRMINTIAEPHEKHGLFRPSVLYLTVQHGYRIEYSNNAKDIQEITRLLGIIKACGNADIKDECESMPPMSLPLKYNGKQWKKVSFTQPDEQFIKRAAELRGMSDSSFMIILSVYSGLTSPAVPHEVVEYGEWLIKKYKILLEDRIRNLKRLISQTDIII